MLDALRDRARAIRAAAASKKSIVLSESAADRPADAKRNVENTQEHWKQPWMIPIPTRANPDARRSPPVLPWRRGIGGGEEMRR
jgi:hypothetical protein